MERTEKTDMSSQPDDFPFHFPGYHGAVEHEARITNRLPAELKQPVSQSMNLWHSLAVLKRVIYTFGTQIT